MGWEATLVRAMSRSELDQLAGSVNKLLDNVAQAWDALNEVEPLIQEAARLKAEASKFGPAFFPGLIPVFNYPAFVAMFPVVGMQAHIKVGVKRIAALDLLFLELSGVYTNIATSLKSAGLTFDVARVRILLKSFDDWRFAASERIYSKVPEGIAERSALRGVFLDKLTAAGLKQTVNNDQPAYMEALLATVKSATAVEAEVKAPAMSGMGLEPVTTAAAIIALVKVVVVVAGVVAALIAINAIVRNYTGPATKAMEAAAELQKRKTIREQAVVAGKMTRAEADAINKKDGEETRKQIEDAAETARKAGPGFPWGTVAIPLVVVGGGLVALKAFKVI